MESTRGSNWLVPCGFHARAAQPVPGSRAHCPQELLQELGLAGQVWVALLSFSPGSG